MAHIPAPAPSHISVHIEIPNAFLQSSSTGLLSVTVSRSYLKKPMRSRVTIKKGPKILLFDLLTSGDPQTCPEANILHHCILLFIIFDLICNMTMFVQNGFWALRGHAPPPPPRPAPRVTSKFRMFSSSPHP